MGLINETNEQYYVGTQSMVAEAGKTAYAFTFDLDLTLGSEDSWDPTNDYYQLNNFFLEGSDDQITWEVYDDDAFSVSDNIITFDTAPFIDYAFIRIRLKNLYNSDSFAHYGGYQYTSLEDVVNNFMVA